MTIARRTARASITARCVVAVGALLGGLLAGGSPASAAPAPGLTRVAKPTFAPGRYIVVLREPAAVSYRGNGPFARTSAPPGRQFDSRTAAVQAYTRHLTRTHRAIAARVGTDVAQDYTIALNGFAARLTGRQAGALAGDRDVLLLAPDRRLKVDSSVNTAQFLGLTGRKGAWARHGGRRHAGAGTVVGVIDTGIWPESKSFAGHRLTRHQRGAWDYRRAGHRTFMDKADGTRFTGVCQTGERFTLRDCSTKLIGARWYPDIFSEISDHSSREYMSPRDRDGHGSHTASTAAGDFGVHAKVEGRDFGRITGMAPGAAIAVYKVCLLLKDKTAGCPESANVAAIDDAVADGVDVINYSLSGSVDTVVDPVELAFEGAAEAGIFVAVSGGNSGPGPETVEHPSPWLTTVAASTYTSFENTVVLGNGQKVVGASIADHGVPMSRLVDSPTVAAPGATAEDAALCAPGSLSRKQVKGTIVICTRGIYPRVDKSAEVARAGGVGMILANPSPMDVDADFHSVPTVHVDVAGAHRIWRYVRHAHGRATAAIRLGNRTRHITPVPQVAGFSSRGPSLANGADILKPDIAAPGVSVLAAVAPPSNSGRRFDLYSGTSMASPHIAGLAAFIASRRPSWSPMQIKSAMMTTARDVFDAKGRRSREVLAEGAGNVRPANFFDPGLFVTATADQWRGLLTGQGLDTGVRRVAARAVNEPSLAAGQVAGSVRFHRRFVSTRKGVWRVSVRVPGFSATTSKRRIVASRPRDVEDLRIRFTRTTAPLGRFRQGFVILRGPTLVRIPVALRPVTVSAPRNVAGSGTDGSVRVPVSAGFTGDLQVNASGLARADSVSDTVPVKKSQYYCVTTTDTTTALRADLDSADDTADLDLYGYVLQGGCTSPAVGYLAVAATSAADESFTVADPAPGSYLIEVNGFADGTDGNGSVDYRLDTYAVDSASGVGGFHAEPSPVPVVAGRRTSFDAVWSGLDPDTRYLGVLQYRGALSPTYVTVDTTTR